MQRDKKAEAGEPPSDIVTRAQALQALLLEARSRELTPEEIEALTALTYSLRRLLDEPRPGASPSAFFT